MYELSIAKYQECVSLVDEYEEEYDEDEELKRQKAGCLNNMALCYKNL